jgi:hypothetical protein
MKKYNEKDVAFILLIPILFMSIMTVGLIPSPSEINANLKEMFIYKECCSYIEESPSHLPILLILSSFLQDQIK